MNVGANQWIESTDTGYTKTWKLKGFKGVYISRTIKEIDAYDMLSTLKKGKYIKEFDREKRKMLKIIGVSDWKTSQRRWLKIKGLDILEVSGTYIDSFKKRVLFIENHIFTRGRVIRFLYIRPFKTKVPSKDYRNFLNKQLVKKLWK